MPDEGKNKQAKPAKPTRPAPPAPPEPGSPEARRQTLMWWVWLVVGFLCAFLMKWILGLFQR